MAGQIVLTAASSGTVTLTPADTGNAFVVTVPAETGNIITTGSTGKTIPRAALPAGSVLQVAQAVKTDTFSTSGWTMVDITGLTVTLTPTSATSKFLVMARVYASGNYYSTYLNLVRNSTTIFTGDAAGSRPTPTSFFALDVTQSNDHGFVHMHSFSYLDSPGTGSAVTYKLQASGRAPSYVMYINRSVPDRNFTEYDSRLASSLIVMEIAA
jgi:hypothetical protein